MLGQAEYAETLTNDVSGLLKEGADWATGVVQNSGQPMGALSALDWFAQNWIILLVTLIVIGLVVDWLVWMIRWRPYRLWFGGRKRPEVRLRERFEEDEDEGDYRPRKNRRPHFEGSALKQTFEEEDPFEDEFALEAEEEEAEFESDDAFEPEAEPEDDFEDFEDFEDFGDDEEEQTAPTAHGLSKPVVSKPKLGMFMRKNANQPEKNIPGQKHQDEEDFEDFGDFDDGEDQQASAPQTVSMEPEDDLFDFEDDFAEDESSEEPELDPAQPQGPQVQSFHGAAAWHTGYTTSIPVVGGQEEKPVMSRKERRLHQK